MGILESFGQKVGELSLEDGDKARKLLLLGYRAQRIRLRAFADKRLPKSKQYLARLIMQTMYRVIAHSEKSAMTSLFVPSEPLLALGYTPFSVEGLSAFMTGTRCQDQLLDSESLDPCLCSYHRIFLGGAERGLLPIPPFCISTNVACDANMITFPFLAEHYHIPHFFIDVPYEISPSSVHYVADELKEMVRFIEDQTKQKLSLDLLRETVERGQQTASLFRQRLPLLSHHAPSGDITSEMYEVMTNHMLLGSEESLKYWTLAQQETAACPPSGKKILWLHTIPFSQAPVRELLNFSPRAHIVASEMSYESMIIDRTSRDPYLTMANRLVSSAFNGSVEHRLQQALKVASVVKPDGVIFFCHWGCKATLASSAMMRSGLEAAGYPTLVLDGDGCDMRSQSNGQTATRLGAFLEMLEDR